MVYTKEEFKRLWETDEYVPAPTYDDIADCAKAWGISSCPRTRPINEITYKVLKAAGVSEAEDYNPDPTPKKIEEIGCGWCVNEEICEKRKNRTIPTRELARICGGFVHYKQAMKKFYFTFGVGIDKPHRNCYHVIDADSYEAARDEMVNRFGLDWAFQYTEEQWQVSKEKYDHMKNWRTVGEWHEGYTQAELFNLEEI